MEKLINDFSLGLFFWQTVLFLALLFLLRKFAWKPILEAVEAREEGIKNAMDKAAKAKAEFENINADNERILNEARVQRDEMLKEAREMKVNLVEEAKEEAKEEANKVMEQAKQTIENEKKAALADIRKQVGSLSIAIAEKVVGSELESKDKQASLVDEMIKEVSLN